MIIIFPPVFLLIITIMLAYKFHEESYLSFYKCIDIYKNFEDYNWCNKILIFLFGFITFPIFFIFLLCIALILGILTIGILILPLYIILIISHIRMIGWWCKNKKV